MNDTKNQRVSLQEARKLILEQCNILTNRDGLQEEHLPLGDCLGRYPARPLLAFTALPGFDQSLRDGYAIAESTGEGTEESQYTIIDEVPAGDTRRVQVGPGEAVRIMTGGLLPHNVIRVVPKEHCRRIGAEVVIEHTFLEDKRNFIHGAGSDVREGQLLADFGKALGPEVQILLSGVGYEDVALLKRVEVSFFCSGSELLSSGEEMLAGKKFSANGHLLQGLIRQAGAVVREQETVSDNPGEVERLLNHLCESEPDILISTGGMGPGKYDLVEAVFRNLGGQVLYNGLSLRPGKSTLLGTMGKTIFFGMPGPPPAVNLLFAELVAPTILALQGEKSPFPQRIEAFLSEDLALPKRGLGRFRRSSLSYTGGRCQVRPVGRNEIANSNIFCPASTDRLAGGDLVTVHLYRHF